MTRSIEGEGTASNFKVESQSDNSGAVIGYRVIQPNGAYLKDKDGLVWVFLSYSKAFKEGSIRFGRKLET